MRFALAIVVVLVPVVMVPAWLQSYTIAPKAALVLAGALLALPWTARSREALGRYASGDGRLLSMLFTATAISLVLSTLLSGVPAVALYGAGWRRLGAIEYIAILALALAAAAHLRKGGLPLLLRATAVAGLVTAAYGIAQYFGWDPLQQAAAYHIGQGEFQIVRPPSTLGHADYAAVWHLYAGFFALALARVDNSTLWRRLGALSAAFAAVAIVLSGSRAALVGLAVGVVVLLIAHPRIARAAMTAAAVAVVAGAVFYVSPAGVPLRARVFWSMDEPFGGARPWLWRDSARMALDEPFTGWGPEQFGLEFPPYESIELSRALPGFYRESPHNVLLDTAVSRGAVGLVLLLAVCGLALRAGWRLRRDAAGAALLAALVAALVAQQFSVFLVPTALWFYLTAALLVGMRGSDSGTPLPGWIPAVCLPAAVACAIIAARLLTADYLLARVQDALGDSDVAAAVATFDRARRWDLPGNDSDLWFARQLAAQAAGGDDRALALNSGYTAAQRAVETSLSRASAWYTLAIYESTRLDAAASEHALREAVRVSPNWFEPHWTLAKTLLATGSLDQAEAEALIASRLNPGEPAIRSTLEEIRARRTP